MYFIIYCWSFGVGEMLPKLNSTPPSPSRFLAVHRFLYNNVDVIPVMNLIVELSFSALNNVKKGGEGSAVIDMKMFSVINLYHTARERQRHLKTLSDNEYKHNQLLDTGRHVVSWATSLLSRVKRMASGRRRVRLAAFPKVMLI